MDKDPEKEPYNPDAGICVNLVFADGGKLLMIIYPESECAYVFGRYVKLSDKLAKEFRTLTK